MAGKKGKPVSFDAMVKFFMMSYDIPTKRDVEKVIDRIDRLEDLIKKKLASEKIARSSAGKASKAKGSRSRSGETASGIVLETMGKFKKGVGFAEIQARTGFGEKKVRNIIFRLDKLGKIKRKNRGIYVVA
jgi:hypothetical protein